MYLVKSTIDGVTRLSEIDDIVIARPGTPTFKHVLGLTNNTSNPDFACFIPAVYEDASMKTALQDEELIISERLDVLDTDAIAIIITDFESKASRHHYPEGTHYQYLYPGDTLTVMNRDCIRLESVE